MYKKRFITGKTFMNILPFVLAIVVFAGVKAGISYPDMVESLYSRGLYPFIAGFVSSLSSAVGFSLWDIFWAGMILVVLAGIVMVILKKLKLKQYLLRVIQLGAITYSLFYLLWGFNYFRPSMEKRLGWHTHELNEGSFRTILDTLIFNANKNRTAISRADYESMERSIEDSYRSSSPVLGLSWPNGNRKPKTILVSSWFAKSGVSGYFGPFFNEVHVNHYQLPVDFPFTLAHEKAHQFGIANEAEANLSAFIACTGSDDIRLRYSGYVHMLIYFLNNARMFDDYTDILAKIDEDVISDLREREKYYGKLRNKKLEKFQSAANDAYLRSNKIDDGIKNYNQVVSLVIRWYEYSGNLDSAVIN